MTDKDIMIEHIPAEKFEFAQLGSEIHDTKLQTKSRGYLADAMIRFKRNQSSVIAAWIIGFLILFAILSPIISPYDIKEMDNTYVNFAPYIESVAKKNIGILDGSRTLDFRSEAQMLALHAIGQETGLDPVISYDSVEETKTERIRGKDVEVTYTTYTNVKYNMYYNVGVVVRNVSYDEFMKIREFQKISGLQVVYPTMEKADIYVKMDKATAKTMTDNPNLWYQVSDSKCTPILDKDGNLIPAYSTDKSLEVDAEHEAYRYGLDEMRIAGDDGSYIYSIAKSGSVSIRVCYYNYYQYLQWAKAGSNGNYHPPMYIFGTNNMGQDLFCAIGVGARFSMVFAVIVSAINLTIGAFYGAAQGYYGGAVDLILDRITDILSEVPFIVVTTLFQLHLARKIGSVPSFLFAFVLTGWIGMAALTRKQFYRFKSQEHILAARTLGAKDGRLMFKHIFPNALGTIVTSCALVIPGVIGSETSLTYLGIVNLSEFAGTSIGTLMQQGQLAMTTAPHAMLFPALFFSLLMISCNLFGNGLRDAFNPTTKGVDG